MTPNSKDSVSGIEIVEKEVPAGGYGMFWEADGCARCIRDGRDESAVMPRAESLMIMSVMDEVRKQGGLKYPEQLESVEYPLQF